MVKKMPGKKVHRENSAREKKCRGKKVPGEESAREKSARGKCPGKKTPVKKGE